MLDELIINGLKEDIGIGDYSTLACIDKNTQGTAKLFVKEDGILAGMELAKRVYEMTDKDAVFKPYFKDGDTIENGDLAYEITGNAQNILSTERFILNCMQRMSGIASNTNRLVSLVAHTQVKILDTRKTTPGFRFMEKWAVKIGGGENHRFGLYDQVMLKDNHIDFCGGLTKAVKKLELFLKENNLSLPVEVEVRNIDELKEVILLDSVNRIMLDNFSPELIKSCLEMIPNGFEVEASGGINEENLVKYAETGVDFISIGALTHHVKSLDLSLKAFIHPNQ